jgi:hypothetical protein
MLFISCVRGQVNSPPFSSKMRVESLFTLPSKNTGSRHSRDLTGSRHSRDLTGLVGREGLNGSLSAWAGSIFPPSFFLLLDGCKNPKTTGNSHEWDGGPVMPR